MRQPMFAKEARKLTKAAFDKEAPAHFGLFIKVTSRLIELAARKGFDFIEVDTDHFREPYENYCVGRLRNMGYDVDYAESETHRLIKISWQ